MNSFKSLIVAIASCFLLCLTSCELDQEIPNEDTSEQQAVPKHIIQKLESAGFHTNEGLYKYNEGYIVENDIYVTEERLDELSKEKTETFGDAKQYRTNNLVSGTRTIRVFIDPSFPPYVKSALDEALRRYNALNLRLTFRRTSSASSNDIRIVPVYIANGFFGSTWFPSNGRPFRTIELNTFHYNNSKRLGNAASVIAHEIGHTIGFRHTDYANTNFSGCPNGGNEGQAGVGAILIPGTPSGPVANSWMLACTGLNTNRPFIASDRTALRRLYARTPPPPTINPVPFYGFYRGGPKANHFYKTDRGTPAGYIYEGVQCKIYSQSVPGTIPLYRFYNSSAVNHFYKTDRSTPAGYRYEGIAGYVYRSGASGRIPLYRFYNSSVVDHLYKTNRSTPAGYTYEGIACYVPR